MTVAELIAALSAIEDKTLPVVLEGCDCYNPAAGELELDPALDGLNGPLHGPSVVIRCNVGRSW
ncbi:MAG: hypothetical protein BGO38_07830 [Cellulomonas sp. 73-145]|uniref:hypothetical protein n=1 Tax=Cellulomonas sp. 73-145 TaxID=1895739 RepID=UPI00092BC5E4|nr:hypothetical protein [Cellulomonas sp. 73-145]MBN9327639.1 hypothetical protein [Cellulomonas sp.]OJV58101.1 MAG: hypothetical protein BGO38_07830 [Cellulomonas sp. 73-145]